LQRLSLARALVINPKIILADEPTGNLDWETADKIIELFNLINKEGKTIIVATHNMQIIKKYKKRVIELKNGTVVRDSAVQSGSVADENSQDNSTTNVLPNDYISDIPAPPQEIVDIDGPKKKNKKKKVKK